MKMFSISSSLNESYFVGIQFREFREFNQNIGDFVFEK